MEPVPCFETYTIGDLAERETGVRGVWMRENINGRHFGKNTYL